MHMRLLNLGRSTDRLALFQSRNPHLSDVTRVSAVDGKNVDRASLVATGVIEADLAYSDGALGCALSHLRVWRDAVQSNQVVTVIEDDAILCSNFEGESERVISVLPDDWDYVMWGYNFDAPLTFHLGAGLSQSTCMFSQDMMRAHAATFWQQKVDALPLKLLRGFGMMAYSVSPRGAERLINFCLPLRPMTTVHPGLPGTIPNRRLDNMLAHAWPAMSAHVAVPPLAISENDADASTVQAGRSQKSNYIRDLFPVAAFEPVVDALGCDGGFVVGLRATHEVELPTAGLRQSGWIGFDIAIDPAKAVKALNDRCVASGFDLLYVGPGCDLQGSLSAILAEFQPRAIVMPPENSLMAHQLAASQPSGQTRPSYTALAEAQGYTVQHIPEAPEHWLLLRDQPGVHALASALRPVAAMDVEPDEVDVALLASCRAEAVRLWH